MRAAIISDYLEEGWFSMDLCAQMLTQTWSSAQGWQIEQICPSFQRRFTHLPQLATHRIAVNSDRLLNRFWDYPRYVKQVAHQFDVFHVCDHTYAQLVHVLPADRTGVYCHDLDAFRSILEPDSEPRPRWYRTMSQHVLEGLQKAAIVFYSTATVRSQLEYYQLVKHDRLIQAPYGVAPEFTPYSSIDSNPLQPLENTAFLLHVGSCIPRKRIDVLLDIFAQLHRCNSQLQLIKVGGEFTPEQHQQIDRLGIRSNLIHYQNLPRTEIAALYRQAAIVLLTSEAEGFGLPLIEALSCGAIVVASDLPVFREVAEDAALYCPVGNVASWVETVTAVLSDLNHAPARSRRLAQANRYSWQTHTNTIVQAYQHLGL